MKMNHKAWAFVRIFVALLTLSAIGLQLDIHLSEGYGIGNFFSYFTNLANIFSSFVLLVGGYLTFRSFKPKETFEWIRGAAVVSMLLVGVVFNTVLLNVDLGSLLPWINNIVHRGMPLLIFVDWFLYPSGFQIRPKQMFLWLIPPALYLGYSVVRGSLLGWYPYPFFDPQKVGGALGVTLYCAGMLIALAGIAVFTMWLSNRRRKTLA